MGTEWFCGRQILGAAALCLVPNLGSAHEVGKSRYDYARHVRPVFERHCASCHRPAGIAPMSLLRYEEAVPWANAVKLMVLERRMPPWLPEEGVGSWRGAKGLTAQELDLVVDWASGGTPKGEGMDGAQEAAFPPKREPQADLTLSALRESILSPQEREKAECVVFPLHLDKNRALVSVELRPDNETIVRSAVIYRGDSCREEDAPLATWLPGDGAFDMPQGSAVVLRRGVSLSARILYRKTWLLDGKPARDRSRLALRFAKDRTVALAQLSLEAGTPSTLARAVRVTSVFPRGVRGASLRLDAVRPGGDRSSILTIERFDPDWSAKYALAVPLELPAGTRLEAVLGSFWIDYLYGYSKVEPGAGVPGGKPSSSSGRLPRCLAGSPTEATRRSPVRLGGRLPSAQGCAVTRLAGRKPLTSSTSRPGSAVAQVELSWP